jgi:ribosomal protein L12E/L44/L45/RPP1/RPP2
LTYFIQISPAPSRPTSPEPPAKKRRVDSGADAEDSPHRRRLHRFLDVSAEEEEDEEEEDEETLSDKGQCLCGTPFSTDSPPF